VDDAKFELDYRKSMLNALLDSRTTTKNTPDYSIVFPWPLNREQFMDKLESQIFEAEFELKRAKHEFDHAVALRNRVNLL